MIATIPEGMIELHGNNGTKGIFVLVSEIGSIASNNSGSILFMKSGDRIFVDENFEKVFEKIEIEKDVRLRD